MEFGLSEDQLLFEETLRRFLADHASTDRLLATVETGGFDPALWQGLAELGIAALLAPAEHGGLGGGCLDSVVLAEALGRATAPVPSLGTSLALLLASRTDLSAWIDGLSDGAVRMAVAMPALGHDLNGLTWRGTRLTGQLTPVPEAVSATHLLLLPEGRPPAIARLTAPHATVTALPSLDATRPVADICFHDAAAIELAESTDLSNWIAEAGRLFVTAEMVGAASGMLDSAIAYARLREQFGRPIGSFQAMKHLFAEMTAQLEPCRALLWMAAQQLDDGDAAASVTVDHAKAHIAEVAREVAVGATQAHGAIGFTHELGLHLAFKRIAANRPLFGTPEQCRARLARELNLTPSTTFDNDVKLKLTMLSNL